LGEWADTAVDWLTSTLDPIFSFIGTLTGWLFDAVALVLGEPAFWIIGLVLVVAAYFASGWKLAVGSLLGFAVIYGVDQWGTAMDTLALVLVAALIAVLIGVPVGIWAARNAKVSAA